MAHGDKISFILIVTTLLWIVQMLISVAIKEYQFPALEETQENYKHLAFELLTKILGIITVMCANWLLLTCSGGIHPVSQLVFIFISMVFAGDYGLPVAHFLEVFRGANKVNDDLNHVKRHPLYKKTWSHNVVFQTGIYTLFILVIIVEQLYIRKVCHQRRTIPSESTRNKNTGDFDTMSSSTASSIGYCPNFENLTIYGYSGSDILRFFIRVLWPGVLALVIDFYSHRMKIYLITIAFYAAILILMILFRCIRYLDGNWSQFHSQCHPIEDSTALQVTFGVFLKASVWGLTFLFWIILYEEVGMTYGKVTLIGIPTLTLFPIALLLHMSDFP